MSDVRLPVPVRKVLTESLDEATLTRLWGHLSAARGNRAVPAVRAWVVALASALVAAALVLLFAHSSAPTALRLADGHEIPTQMAAGAKAHLSFDDASTVEVAAGTHLDLLETTGHAFGMAMRSGTIVAEVEPGGPRLWRIECGPVTVEVVGTRFTVERTPHFVRVAVERGAVIVRGDPVPDRVVRIGAGQSIVVPLPEAALTGAKAAPAPSGTVFAGELDGTSMKPAWPFAEEGHHPARTTAVAEAVGTSRGTPPETSPVTSAVPAPSGSVMAFPVPEPAAARPSVLDSALAEADTLRRSGRFVEAARVLELVLAEHGSEPSAPLAEFSLGRLYLDSLGNPRLASVHLAGAIARGLPVALSEDAQARLVEARARAGDPPGAQGAAAKYHALYPGGRHSSEVDRWFSFAP
jgi:transmembrane sensor